MLPSEGASWREYDVQHTISIVVPITIQPGRLRLRQHKNRGRTYHMNLTDGVFLTSAVFEQLLRDGRLTAHKKRRQRFFVKRP